MRKKQARPAKRPTGAVLVEEEGLPENVRELFSPGWRCPSSSPPTLNGTTSSAESDEQAGSSFHAPPEQGMPDIFHCDAPPPLKIPKYELGNFISYPRGQEHSRLPRAAAFTHSGSLNGRSSRRSVPLVSCSGDNHTFFHSVFTANRNPQRSSSFDVPRTSVSPVDGTSEAADSESPLKRLERCVRVNSEAGCSTSVLYRSSRPSTSPRYTLAESRTNANSMKLRFGYDSMKTSAADALGELSQLVHRIGAAKLPVPATPSKCIPNSVTSNIFTCLKCAQRFDTLDELVLHISTTKHFTRGSTKNLDAVAPWERDRTTANFEKRLASSNFLASLFYAQKYLEVPQDLSQKKHQ